MDDGQQRVARVLDPAYVAGLDTCSVDELHAKHAECIELETEASYVRRLAQARIDILEAEVDRRVSGESVEDLVRKLPQILADAGPRAAPAASRLPLQMAPTHDGEWTAQLQAFEGTLVNLPNLSDDGLRQAIDDLKALERAVSDQRRALFDVIDRVELGLAERLSAAHDQ
jgi:hypothetical protein